MSTIDHIEDGELGFSVRSKLNALIDQYNATVGAGEENLLLETATVSLADIVGPIPAALNMGPWTKDATYTDFNWTDMNYNGHPNGFTKDGVTVGASVLAPDGTTTGQHLTESAGGGNHRVHVFFCAAMTSNTNISFRTAVIAKAATRTRIVVESGIRGLESSIGASVGFDLAGGNVGYDVVIGSSAAVSAYAMTDLGDGWWLCQFDMNYTGAYAAVSYNWTPKIYLDNGSGTAARSISYTGDGTSGVYAWWVNVLPTAAWPITNKVFDDDFESLDTIDLTNSLSPGFNWYINNKAPNSLNTTWWGALPVTDTANLTISSPSVLQIYNPNTSAPVWNSMIYSCGYPVAGGFVGQSWQAPIMVDALCQWDSTLSYADYSFLGPAVWTHTREGMEGPMSMNPSKHWLEWDITDIGAQSGGVFDHYLDASNLPDSGNGSGFAPSVSMSPSDWHRISGLWLNMVCDSSGQGITMAFFDGSFTQYSDMAYSVADYPQPPGALAKGWNSQNDWQHFQIILDTGNNSSAVAHGGWPMRMDWIRVYTHPSPPKIYNYWNIFDQLGTITVGSNGLVLTKTTGGTVWAPIRASIGKNSGKWYWEWTITGTVASATALILGIMSHQASVGSNQYPGGSGYGAGAGHGYNWNGLLNGVTAIYTGGPVVFASGDVFGFAFDADAGKMYIHRNGTWVNGAPGGAGVWDNLNATTKWYPSVSIHDASLATVTANFGQAAFAYALPSGYLGMAAN